jgi:hypothetical protein
VSLGVRAAALIGALVASALLTVPGVPARAAGGCAFPRPGTTSAGPAPAVLRAEYNVLARAPRPSDHVALRQLGPLTLSGILPAGIRYLGAAAFGGRVYLVPGRHLLASPLTPVACEAPSRRALERALLPSLRAEYAHAGLCLVVRYPTQVSPTCQPAPGTVAAFLFGPGSPGFGLAPDGVAGVVLHFRLGPALHAPVRQNFWIVNDPTLLATPCGLDWTEGGTVLRTVASCSSDTT